MKSFMMKPFVLYKVLVALALVLQSRFYSTLVLCMGLSIFLVGCPTQSIPLVVSVNGPGMVQFSPPGGNYSIGTQVTITARPGAGARFERWEGDLTGSVTSLTVPMLAPVSATAVFSTQSVTLTTGSIGQGDVIPTPTGNIYSVGTTVTLIATPASGWKFDHWEGELAGNANPAQITLSANASVTAVFLPDQFTFVPQVIGQGVLQVAPGGSTFAAGTLLTLEAVPDPGFRFDHWEGDLLGNGNPETLVMDASKAVTAVFTPLQFQLITEVTGLGSVSLSPAGGVYDFGSIVILNPLPAPGWKFHQWGGALAGNQPAQQVTITGDITVSAEFIRREYGLTVQTFDGDGTPSLGGSVSLDPPGGVYPSGTVVTLRPLPDAQHRFDVWYGSDLQGNAVPASIVMDGNRSVAAYFSFLDNPQLNPSFLTPAGDKLFFLASTPWTGNELWSSDGTLAGTHLVRDLNPGPFGTQTHYLCELESKAYLFAFYDSDWRIFASDGTAAGTTPVAALGGESPLSAPLRVGNAVYFNTLGSNTSAIWRTDGSTAGTYKIEESSPPLAYVLHNLSGMLYFTTNDPEDVSVPTRLWKSGGTPGSSTLLYESSKIGDVVALNDIPVFAAADGTDQDQLGIFAGTELPHLIYKFGSGPGLLTPAGGLIYFLATAAGLPYSDNLWVTDGLVASPVATSAYYTRDYFELDGALIYKGFFHNGVSESYGLFRADQSVGTLLRVINPSIGYGPSPYQVNVGGTLFFNAENSTGGIGLWKTDGTESGTLLVSEISANGSGPVELVRLSPNAYFFAEESAHGRQLWRSDGSTAGTFPVSYPRP